MMLVGMLEKMESIENFEANGNYDSIAATGRADQ